MVKPGSVRKRAVARRRRRRGECRRFDAPANAFDGVISRVFRVVRFVLSRGGMRRFLFTSAFVVSSSVAALVLAADDPSSVPPTAEHGETSSDRVTASIGAPAVGGLWIHGDDGHSFPGLSSSSPGVVAAVEYGRLFTSWLEVGVGFQMQHQLDSSLAAYRPYASVRAFVPLHDAELGFALRAGPTWFHFFADGTGYTFGSVAPSVVFDGRVWISDRVSLVGAMELLVSGARIDAPGTTSYLDNSQLWNVAAIASVGVGFRL